MKEKVSTYAGDALPGWPNVGWGGAGPAGWQSSTQHGSVPEKDKIKLISTWLLPISSQLTPVITI